MPLHRHASRLCAAPICLYSLKSLLYIACGQLKRDRSAVRAEAYAWVVHHRIADIFDVRDIVLTPRLDSSLAGCLKQRPLVHIALRAFCAVSAAAQRGEYLHEYVPGRRLLDLRRTRGQLYSKRFLIGIERKPGLFYLVAILTRRRKLLRRELQDLGYEQKLLASAARVHIFLHTLEQNAPHACL